MEVQIERLGEAAICLTATGAVTLEVQRRMWALAAIARGWAEVEDAVVGLNGVTVFADVAQAAGEALQQRLRAAWESSASVDPPPSTQIDIPVRYGGDDGPDLAEVARVCGLSEAEVVERHAAVEYVVYFLGFLPGFAYLGSLDPKLSVARRTQPRVVVPAGSVGITGSQTGVYPSRSPGGWQLIGRTTRTIFDPERHPAALLKPGDRVRFIPR